MYYNDHRYITLWYRWYCWWNKSPTTTWDIYHISWCRISSINSCLVNHRLRPGSCQRSSASQRQVSPHGSLCRRNPHGNNSCIVHVQLSRGNWHRKWKIDEHSWTFTVWSIIIIISDISRANMFQPAMFFLIKGDLSWAPLRPTAELSRELCDLFKPYHHIHIHIPLLIQMATWLMEINLQYFFSAY